MSGDATNWRPATKEELDMLTDLTELNCNLTKWEENFLHELHRKQAWSDNMRSKLADIYEKRIENA